MTAQKQFNLNLNRSNSLHKTADNLFMNYIRYGERFDVDFPNVIHQIIEDNSIVPFVSEALNDTDAWYHPAGKDKIKSIKGGYIERICRTFATYHSIMVNDERTFPQYLDITFNRTDRVYHVSIEAVPDGKTVNVKTGKLKDMVAKPADKDETNPERPDSAEMVKELTKDKDNLVKSLNVSAGNIADLQKEIEALKTALENRDAEIEILKKDKSILVDAILKTPRTPKVLKEMVANI